MFIINRANCYALVAGCACAMSFLFSADRSIALTGYAYPTKETAGHNIGTCPTTIRNVYDSFGSHQIGVFYRNSSGAAVHPSGIYRFNGNFFTGLSISAGSIITDCGLTNVINLTTDSLATDFVNDAYMGFSFRGTEASGITYDYAFALSGASPTTIINTKVAIITDATPPTVNIGALSGPSGGVYTATITISEATTDFVTTDLSLTNATATLTGSGTSYVATLTPAADGMVALSVDAGTFSDAAGNFNTVVSNTVAATYDSTSPTVLITGVPISVTGTTTFSASVAFSETVTGFDATDIDATNASVTAITGSGASYVATVAATGNGDVVLSIPAGAATDTAGNPNIAGTAVSVANQTVTTTQDVIANAMFSRANALVSNQPRLSVMLSGGIAGTFDADVTQGRGVFDLTTGTDNPFWLHLRGAWSTVGTAETDYAFGAVGSHLSYNENLLVGAMVQFDYSDTIDGTSRSKSTGWMAGPYVVVRLENQPLYFEGSLLYGKTDNDVSPLGTYTDNFDTDRLLATAGVTGEIETSRMTLYPNLRLSHTKDTQQAYSDGLGNMIAEQSITLGELSAGLDFSMPVAVRQGEMFLTGGFNGVWSQPSATGAASIVVPEFDGGHTRLNFGLSHTARSGMNTRISAHYDGLGAQAFKSYGIELSLDLQF